MDSNVAVTGMAPSRMWLSIPMRFPRLTQITNHYYYGTNYSAPSGTAPSITAQPASRTNNAGQTATFTVTASGTPPLAYQWKVQSSGSYVNLSNAGKFSGVTTSTLTISELGGNQRDEL